MATQDEIDQQRRVVGATRVDVQTLLDVLGQLQSQMQTYVRLGLGDNQILDEAAFIGTGTNRADYQAAMGSLDALNTLLAAGHGTNLETFAR